RKHPPGSGGACRRLAGGLPVATPFAARELLAGRLLVGLLEPDQLLVAAANDGIERLLGFLLAGPHLLEFLVDDGANLHEVADTDAARLLGGLADHLRDRHVGARVLLVEARFLG